MTTVLVTGGTGFVGAHAVAQLLDAGHTVRTTMRHLTRQGDVEKMLDAARAPHRERVSYLAADLGRDDGWAQAAAGADYVLHIASPFPGAPVKHEDDLIIPARDGALRVLRAARDAGVRRVVLTSSFAAVGYSRGNTDRVFTEADWTRTDEPGVAPYIKSKAIAERAAWDFIESEGGGLELSVINPVGIFGPVLGPDFSPSIQIIKTMLDGGMRAAPPMWTHVVDVRDVADAHVRAMTSPVAAGQRYLALAGAPLSFAEIGRVLHASLGEAAAKAPTRAAPAWLIKLMARFSPRLTELVPQLNVVRRADNTKIREQLGWTPRSNEETVTASAESLIRLGLQAA
ncbi:SDR family oxidoreductase [Mangrovihabitans endophyticus]|uniref:Dihydroflavonol-4-reductase n=1 Tax=Mangrovihabitans endophyticus TaxID=1751298 RepID=A0A8J3C4P2_9ACTN|nr:aldehyde reductase [Mangrovihabitans endophyticus]GGL08874.1 dihydroflavonol-4-reductase [Mangrovihabitans endophyticus]